MKVYCVRIGDKYGPEYETYIESKLKKYEVVWIREQFDEGVFLQWNKMLPMSYNSKEPVVVIDIDLFLVGDYEKLFDYEIERGEFLAMPGWWRDDTHSINGGFFKYHPCDCNYIFEEFMNDPKMYQSKYILNGTTTGPVNGEQHFVEDMVKNKLKLRLIPDAWVTRWASSKLVEQFWDYAEWQAKMTEKYKEKTGNNYIFDGNKFHPDIKLVHFTNTMNKPHDWSHYRKFV